LGRGLGTSDDEKWRLNLSRVAIALAMASSLGAWGCDSEKRTVDATAPVTAPTGRSDPRLPAYADNKFQQSQGGLYFTWYGCGQCHSQSAQRPQNFSTANFRYGGDIPFLYQSIADGRAGGMPAYKDRVPAQQIWQMASYVKSLPKTNQYLRRREDLDQKGQPTGTTWSGAVR